jgi:hypothetical protein
MNGAVVQRFNCAKAEQTTSNEQQSTLVEECE